MSYQDKNLKSLKYKIYSVPNYKKYVLEVKNHKITVEAPCFASRKFKKIVKELETYDCQYHLNIYLDDMLKLNIDIDGMHMDFLEKFYEDIDEYFKSIGVNRINFSNTINLKG